MGDIIFYVLLLTMAAVVAVLMLGLGSFAKGGTASGKYSNKMMRLRILFQFIAVLLILAYVSVRNMVGAP